MCPLSCILCPISYILSMHAVAFTVLAAPYPMPPHMLTARAENAPMANAKMIYFMADDPAGNSIIAMKVRADGTLAQGSSTGGSSRAQPCRMLFGMVDLLAAQKVGVCAASRAFEDDQACGGVYGCESEAGKAVAGVRTEGGGES